MYQRNQPYTPYASTVFADYATGGNSYSVFLHGDHPLMKIETDLNNGRKIMVVKESFGNAFAPFLVENYENVYIVDYRYIKNVDKRSLTQMVDKYKIDDVLFVNNVSAVRSESAVQMMSNFVG